MDKKVLQTSTQIYNKKHIFYFYKFTFYLKETEIANGSQYIDFSFYEHTAYDNSVEFGANVYKKNYICTVSHFEHEVQ